jgi:hypothetical protein
MADGYDRQPHRLAETQGAPAVSDQPNRVAVRGATALRCVFVALLPWSTASLLAQEQRPAQPQGAREATAARPTPNADNESDDSDRRPAGRKTVAHKLPDGAEVKVAFGLPKTGGREYAEMESLAEDKVVRFFDAAAIKLSTQADLLFGETKIRRSNVAPDYPGVYSLWLQRTADGWRLLFNERADAWGTQHDPAADVASAPLRHDEVDGLTTTFEARIQESAQRDGTILLELLWGKHRWTAIFRAAS